ncbi:MAG: DUF624 domain-containing protein [Herpetosiphonaceae bacterium]|nr:DUF624 domain-containing protein [Herpetosiphonaceae bacterium]
MAWEIVTWSLRLLWRHLGLFLLANVLWLVLTLCVVTWPAATGGLFYLVEMVVREEWDNGPQDAKLSDFWVGFKQFGLRSTALALMDLAIIVLIAGSFWFYSHQSWEPLRWLVGPISVVGVAWAGAQLYLFPLMIRRPSHGLASWLRESLLITVSYPANTCSLLLVALVLAFAALILAGPFLLIFFSILALLQTIALRFVLIQRGEVAPIRSPKAQATRPSNRRFPK